MTPDFATYIRAFESTWHGLAELCAGLTDEQWAAPTDLPGWSVKDNVSHIVGEELFLLGEPAPEHELPADLPHLNSDFAREVELPVDFRRSRSGPEVLSELRAVTERRLAVLHSCTERELDSDVEWAGRRMPMSNMLGIRAFDCWTHEQDVRRAVGARGGLDGPGAQLAQARLLRALSGWTDDVPNAAGRTVVITMTGPNATTATLLLGPEQQEGAPAVRIMTDFETFVRLATGRVAYDDVAARVTLEGDAQLGTELCRHMAVTP